MRIRRLLSTVMITIISVTAIFIFLVIGSAHKDVDRSIETRIPRRQTDSVYRRLIENPSADLTNKRRANSRTGTCFESPEFDRFQILATTNPVTFTQTPTGFFYPIGAASWGLTGGTWLGRDAAHGGSPPYTAGYYHLGVDMPAPIGDSVFAISNGTVVATSTGGWGTGNIAVLVRHTANDGTEFLAVYGHVHSDVVVGQRLSGGVSFAVIGPYPEGGNHLHFSVIMNTSQTSDLGRAANASWPNRFNHVDPVNFILTVGPKCGDATSENYSPDGSVLVHPDGTVFKKASQPDTYIKINGRKRLIPTPERLFNLYGPGVGFGFQNVITISNAEFNSMPTDSPIGNNETLPNNGPQFKPDGYLIRSSSGQEISIVSNGVRRPFISGIGFLGRGYLICNIWTVNNYGSYTEGVPVEYFDGGGVPDEFPPQLAVTSHSEGQTVSTSSITLSGTATDNGRGESGISSVKVNGSRASGDTATGSGIATWSFNLPLVNGSNVITIQARDASPAQNLTQQTLTIFRSTGNACPAATILPGQTLSGSLTSADCVISGTNKRYDVYSFSGVAGQQIAASMNSTDIDPYLFLLSSSNQILDEDDNSGPGTNSRIPGSSGFFTLPATDIYFLWTSSATDNSTGNYTVGLSECSFSISSSENTVGPGNGGGGFLVDTTSSCVWSAVSDSPSWLTTSSSGSGDGRIDYSFTANSSTTSRSGRITVGGQVSTITQIGVGGAGSVQLSSTNFAANEEGGNATITVTRSSGIGSGTVFYSTSDGTATAGIDYEPTSGLLIFSENVTSRTIIVTILDDGIREGSETINLSLSNASTSMTLGNPNTAILTIIDNEISPQNNISSFDYDGDGKTDLSVYRASTHYWYISKSSDSSFRAEAFGMSGDKIVPADYDGDGKTDIAVFRPLNSYWYILNSSNSTFRYEQWGQDLDRVTPADYDGDGKADLAVFRPSNGTWYIRQSSNGMLSSIQFGLFDDWPVNADYDGDGMADVAVWRPTPGTFYIRKSSTGEVSSVGWGSESLRDVPVPGDYDADGVADIAVFRLVNGTWYIRRSSDGGNTIMTWGTSADKPVPGDYNGDGQWELAVFRRSNGYWYIFDQASGNYSSAQWGVDGDLVVPAAYLKGYLTQP